MVLVGQRSCYCNRANGPRSVLVMDNASAHWNEELVAMCDTANVILVCLPPYSSGFNPIETSLAILKAWTKRHSIYCSVSSKAVKGRSIESGR